MGQTQSGADSGATGITDHVQRHAFEARKIATLSYAAFIQSVEELNKIADSFCDRSGKKLLFHIKKDSDATILWKWTVRVKCHKVNGRTGVIETTRVLTLRQYLHLYNEMKRRSWMATLNRPSSTGDLGSPTDLCASMILTECVADSQLVTLNACRIDSHFGSHGSEDREMEECCICMEKKANVILRCQHSYCEKCIDEWYVMNKTCPICRARVNTSKDSWVLTEKPDTEEMAKETTAYLMHLTDKSGIKDRDDSG